MTMFERIIEEKKVIDPVIWMLRIQYNHTDEHHEEYVRAMSKRWKNNPRIMKELQQYFELWKIK